MRLDQPTIVFVTACAKDRARWLACDEAHRILTRVWREADAWLVGRYVLMPDHLHLFAAPRDLSFTLKRWLTYWKSQFTQSHCHANWVWQASSFHHRLRREADYGDKLLYSRENPVRAGLVSDADQWPYQGAIHDLHW